MANEHLVSFKNIFLIAHHMNYNTIYLNTPLLILGYFQFFLLFIHNAVMNIIAHKYKSFHNYFLA